MRQAGWLGEGDEKKMIGTPRGGGFSGAAAVSTLDAGERRRKVGRGVGRWLELAVVQCLFSAER